MHIKMQLKNHESVKRKLAKLAEIGRVSNWLGGVGEKLITSHKRRHKQQIAPSGVAWVPLKATTRKRKKHPDMLYETGDMLNSLAYQQAGNNLLLGFSDQKAKWHHTGTKHIPARPLLGISPSDNAQIYALVDDLIADALRSYDRPPKLRSLFG